MLSVIISPNNGRVKDAVSLKESRVRRRRKLFLVDGVREIERVSRSAFELETVFWNAGDREEGDDCRTIESILIDDGVDRERARLLADLLPKFESKGAMVVPLGARAFQKLCFGDRNERVVAVVKGKEIGFETFEREVSARAAKLCEAPLVGVVENIEKPGNLGAIIRSADGAGVGGLIVVSNDYDLYNPNVIRNSLGAIFHMPIIVSDPGASLEWLRAGRYQRATALCDDSIPYSRLDYTRPTAIILGTEAVGLTPVWSEESEIDRNYDLLKKIRLPMLGVADSLNVSNAAAIFFYEARRVRGESRLIVGSSSD